MTDEIRPTTTTDAGIPAASDEHSLTIGPDGPILLQDHYAIQKMAQFNRERVPERVVHAKGGGAHGFFEVTEDAAQFCKADFLSEVGKKTPVFLRFSSVAGELGSPDTQRDPRGFALKFYTQEGNYDMVGNNTPIFFVKDPSKFQDFIHSQKRMAETNLRSHEMQWDFWTGSPESAHQVSFLMTDRGTPKSWRHMHGFSSHTFLWENAAGEKHWVKYHFKTEQGIENFTDDEAADVIREDADHHIRDLFNAISKGDAPEWRLEMQLMPFEEAAEYRFNPFDLTKVWPHGDYPPVTIGRLVLDRNPENYFAEVEQAAFEPANMVPGIGPSPDKMLLGRLFSYPDTHRYRIGANYLQLPINAPKSEVHSYNKDGAMRYSNPGDPVYAPNTLGGPKADPAKELPHWMVEGGEIMRAAATPHAEDGDFVQPGTFVREVLSDTDVDHLVDNIVGHATAPEVSSAMHKRVVEYWTNVDADLGARIASGVGADAASAGGNGAAPAGSEGKVEVAG
jgi:catalase